MPFLGGRASASRGFFGGGATPNEPTSLSSLEGNGQLTISFTAPVSDGGMPIGNYQYALSTDGVSFGSWLALSPPDTTSPITIGGLTNGTQYYVKIRAVNPLGGGEESEVISTNTTPYTIPSPPAITTTTPGNGQVYIEYTEPSNGGRTITEYFYRYSSNGGTSWSSLVSSGSNLNETVTGLTNGTSYIFQVVATNLAGNSDYSASSTATTPRTVPSKVSTPTSSSGDKSFTISWNAPANGGSAITNYTVEYSTNGGSTWTGTDTTTSTSYTWTVLNGSSYVGRVRANNVAGNGQYSDASVARTPTFAAPTFSVATNSGFPTESNTNTWYKRPFTITYSPTNCVNYDKTYYYVQRVTDATGNTNTPGASEVSGFTTLSSANQTVSISTYTLNSSTANVGYGEYYKIRVETRNTDGHPVSTAWSVRYTGNAQSYWEESAELTAPRTQNITVTSASFPRTYFLWPNETQPLSFNGTTQRVVKVSVRAKIAQAKNTVSLDRNPSLRVTGNSQTTTLYAKNLYDLAGLRGVGPTTQTAIWDHTDINDNYTFTGTSTQRYSIEGGGSFQNAWTEVITVNLDISYYQRTNYQI